MEETRVEEREIKAACTELSIAYARHVDLAEYDAFVDLFTDDAVLNLGFKLEGRAAIEKSMTKRSSELRSRHVMTNIHIEVLSATEAKGISYLTLYRHQGPESLDAAPVEFHAPAAVGHYADEYRKTDQGWKIAHRRIELAFRKPEHFP